MEYRSNIFTTECWLILGGFRDRGNEMFPSSFTAVADGFKFETCCIQSVLVIKLTSDHVSEAPVVKRA